MWIFFGHLDAAIHEFLNIRGLILQGLICRPAFSRDIAK
jgi:hypothetical protein